VSEDTIYKGVAAFALLDITLPVLLVGTLYHRLLTILHLHGTSEGSISLWKVLYLSLVCEDF